MAETETDPIVGALRDLLQSEGWRLLRAQADQEWGPVGMGRRMAEAIERVAPGPDRAYELAEAAERTYNTARAVNDLVSWPDAELRARTQAQEPVLTTVRDRMLATMRGRRRAS